MYRQKSGSHIPTGICQYRAKQRFLGPNPLNAQLELPENLVAPCFSEMARNTNKNKQKKKVVGVVELVLEAFTILETARLLSDKILA